VQLTKSQTLYQQYYIIAEMNKLGRTEIITQADKISPTVRTRNQSILFRRFSVRWTRIWPQNCSITSGFWNIL